MNKIYKKKILIIEKYRVNLEHRLTNGLPRCAMESNLTVFPANSRCTTASNLSLSAVNSSKMLLRE